MKSTSRRSLGFPAGVMSTVTGASGSSGRSTAHDLGMSLAFTVLRVVVVVLMPAWYHGAAASRKSPPPHDAVRQAKLPKVTPRHRPAPAPFPALNQKLADRAKVSRDLVRHSKHGSVGPFPAVRPPGAIVTTSRHRIANVQVRVA